MEQYKALELRRVIVAEAGDLSRALERFGQAINLLTERASAYNNQALGISRDTWQVRGDTLESLQERP